MSYGTPPGRDRRGSGIQTPRAGGQRAKAASEPEESCFSRKEGHAKVREEHGPRHWKVEGSVHLENSGESSVVRTQGWGQRVGERTQLTNPLPAAWRIPLISELDSSSIFLLEKNIYL